MKPDEDREISCSVLIVFVDPRRAGGRVFPRRLPCSRELEILVCVRCPESFVGHPLQLRRPALRDRGPSCFARRERGRCGRATGGPGGRAPWLLHPPTPTG